MFVLGEEITQEVAALLEDESVMRAGFANRETRCEIDEDRAF